MMRSFSSVACACVLAALPCAAAPARGAAPQGGSEKLNAPLDYVYFQGDVESFRVSANALWLAYLANQDGPEKGLYVVSTDGSQGPFPVSAPGAVVGDFQFSPVGTRLVFQSGPDLYRAGADGTRIQLSTPFVGGGSVSAFRISPDGQRVAFVADEDGSTLRRLHSAPIDGSASAVLLSPTSLPGSDVFDFLFSPDGARIVFHGDVLVDNRQELFGVPADGSAAPVLLNGTLVAGGRVIGSANPQDDLHRIFRISPDGSRIVYLADALTDNVVELFSASIQGGSAPVRLNAPPVLGGNVKEFLLRSGSSRVVYRSDEDVNGVFGLYSVPIGGGQAPVKLSQTESVRDVFAVAPSGARAAYVAVPGGSTQPQVYAAPVDGSSPRVQLSALPTVGSADLIAEVSIAPNSSRVVYQVDSRLFSAPLDGSSPGVELSALVPDRDSVSSFRFLPGSGELVYCCLRDRLGVSTGALVRVPLDGSRIPVELIPGARVGSWCEADFQIAGPDVVFRDDLAHDEVTELQAVPSDASADPRVLNGPLRPTPQIADVNSIALAPDGSSAAYGTADGAFGVPLAAPEAVKRLATAPSSSVSFGPDPRRVFFHGFAEGTHLFTALGDMPFSAVQLSRGAFAAGFGAAGHTLSPDGSRVLFGYALYDGASGLYSTAADGSAEPVFVSGAFSGPVSYTDDGARMLYLFNEYNPFFPTPGRLFVRATDLSGPALELAPYPLGTMAHVTHVALCADGASVVYRCDQDVAGKFELYRVPLDGSVPPVKVSGVLGDDRDLDNGLLVTPDRTRAVFSADRDLNDVFELFVVPVDGSAAPLQLSGPMVAGGDIARERDAGGFERGLLVRFSPDGTRLVYVADQEEDERFELFSVPLDGSAAPVKLNSPLVVNGDLSRDPAGVRISPDGTRVVFLADATLARRNELYSAPLDGHDPAIAISGALAGDRDVELPFVFLEGTKAVLFRADLERDGKLELWLAEQNGAGSPRLCSDVANDQGVVQPDFVVAPDESFVYYRADALEDETIEFFRVPLGRTPFHRRR